MTAIMCSSTVKATLPKVRMRPSCGGWLTSAGYGYTLARPIGYGYIRNPDGVTADYVNSGTYELEVATHRVRCTVSLRPLYDPTMSRIKA